MSLDKSSLRRQFLATRMALEIDFQQEAARAIARHIASLEWFQQAKIIAGYLPIRGEVDPSPILEKARNLGKILCLPVVDKPTGLLGFRVWHEGDRMEKDAYGTPIPPPEATMVIPDLILVALLAFDARGHRLGYGGGYYDRTLAQLRKQNSNLKAIGLAYNMQQVDNLPVEPTDQILDAVVTEKGLQPTS